MFQDYFGFKFLQLLRRKTKGHVVKSSANNNRCATKRWLGAATTTRELFLQR
jgi:hypothetical protein